MINWRIYYGDGTTFDNTQGRPEDAPKLNVQCIAVNERGTKTFKAVLDVGHVVLHDWDYYIYQEDTGWFGVREVVDLVDHVLHSSHKIKAVGKARSIPTGEFKAIYKQAWRDPDFPKKTSYRKDEADQHFGRPEDD